MNIFLKWLRLESVLDDVVYSWLSLLKCLYIYEQATNNVPFSLNLWQKKAKDDDLYEKD